MNTIEKLGFDSWFWSSIPSGKDTIDLSKTTDFWVSIPSGKIVRVISVNKITHWLGRVGMQEN